MRLIVDRNLQNQSSHKTNSNRQYVPQTHSRYTNAYSWNEEPIEFSLSVKTRKIETRADVLESGSPLTWTAG